MLEQRALFTLSLMLVEQRPFSKPRGLFEPQKRRRYIPGMTPEKSQILSPLLDILVDAAVADLLAQARQQQPAANAPAPPAQPVPAGEAA